MQSIGKEKAIEMYESKWWEAVDYRKIAEFQISVSELCCPFDVFHEAVEKTLNRPVFTHEFGLNYNGIYNKIFNNAPAPSFEQILDLIPKDKQVIVLLKEEENAN